MYWACRSVCHPECSCQLQCPESPLFEFVEEDDLRSDFVACLHLISFLILTKSIYLAIEASSDLLERIHVAEN